MGSTLWNAVYNFAKNGVSQYGIGSKHSHFYLITHISWRGGKISGRLKEERKCVKNTKTEDVVGKKHIQRVWLGDLYGQV